MVVAPTFVLSLVLNLCPFVLIICFSEGISKVKTPAVKAFKATYQGRYTLRDCEGDALSMSAMETVTDLLLEIMEVGPLVTQSSLSISQSR